MANTLMIHCIIDDRRVPFLGLTMRWKWFPITQKFSTSKSYFLFARSTTSTNNAFIAPQSRIISFRFARAITWYRAPSTSFLGFLMPTLTASKAFLLHHAGLCFITSSVPGVT